MNDEFYSHQLHISLPHNFPEKFKMCKHGIYTSNYLILRCIAVGIRISSAIQSLKGLLIEHIIIFKGVCLSNNLERKVSYTTFTSSQ